MVNPRALRNHCASQREKTIQKSLSDTCRWDLTFSGEKGERIIVIFPSLMVKGSEDLSKKMKTALPSCRMEVPSHVSTHDILTTLVGHVKRLGGKLVWPDTARLFLVAKKGFIPHDQAVLYAFFSTPMFECSAEYVCSLSMHSWCTANLVK